MAVAPGENADHFGQWHGIGDLELRLRTVPAVEKRALAFQGDDGVTHDRIMNETRHRLALDCNRKQRAESGKTGSIIESAVDGIDHESKRRIGKRRNDGLVRLIRLFADYMGLREPLQQSGCYCFFSENIRLGNEINGGGLFRDSAGAQVSEAGKNFVHAGSGNGGNEEVDIFIGKGHR
ncbi:hypothetical protein D3C78_954210 [compost metagenome]